MIFVEIVLDQHGAKSVSVILCPKLQLFTLVSRKGQEAVRSLGGFVSRTCRAACITHELVSLRPCVWINKRRALTRRHVGQERPPVR